MKGPSNDPRILFQEHGNRVWNCQLHVICRKCHVYMNMMDYSNDMLSEIKSGHRVHIFFSSLPPYAYEYGYKGNLLTEFIHEAYLLSGNKVILHVGKSALSGTHLLSDDIKMYLDMGKLNKEFKLVISDSDVYMIYTERDYCHYESGLRFICSKRDHKYSATRYVVMPRSF